MGLLNYRDLFEVRAMDVYEVDVPWRDELVTDLPDINNGIVTIPVKPGWGTDLNESALKQYAI